MEIPQIMMVQPFPEYPHKAVLADSFVRGQVLSEKFSRHKKSVCRYGCELQILSPALPGLGSVESRCVFLIQPNAITARMFQPGN